MSETFTPPVLYGTWDLGMAFLLGVALGVVVAVSALLVADDRR